MYKVVSTKQAQAEHRKYQVLADAIITKLQKKIHDNGYYENLGQDELRGFEDKLNKSNLTYPEKFQLKSSLSERIDNL